MKKKKKNLTKKQKAEVIELLEKGKKKDAYLLVKDYLYVPSLGEARAYVEKVMKLR